MLAKSIMERVWDRVRDQVWNQARGKIWDWDGDLTGRVWNRESGWGRSVNLGY